MIISNEWKEIGLLLCYFNVQHFIGMKTMIISNEWKEIGSLRNEYFWRQALTWTNNDEIIK